jgi:hypothetical protein
LVCCGQAQFKKADHGRQCDGITFTLLAEKQRKSLLRKKIAGAMVENGFSRNGTLPEDNSSQRRNNAARASRCRCIFPHFYFRD